MSIYLAIFSINQSSWSYVHQLRYYKSAINFIKSHFSYGFSHGFPIFLWFSHGFPMVFPFSYGFPMVFPWFSHFPMVFPWFSRWVFPCSRPDINFVFQISWTVLRVLATVIGGVAWLRSFLGHGVEDICFIYIYICPLVYLLKMVIFHGYVK